MSNRTNRTHVKYVKDPEKILLPGSNLVLVAFGEDESVERISFTLLDDLPLDLGQSSTIENVCERPDHFACSKLVWLTWSTLRSRRGRTG